ncbi:hypothetical protein A3Q56_02574 [Intoshia linei]|uniref:RhoGAP domain containing protein n=1 Tax=Intoshia linei TaxID=1819745 RepID=A0A177B7R6_9BILA|nr:hypothetical protein A3Q56_02574 [Intoshia linei]
MCNAHCACNKRPQVTGSIVHISSDDDEEFIDKYHNMVKSIKMAGISIYLRNKIFKTLVTIMHIGNVDYVKTSGVTPIKESKAISTKGVYYHIDCNYYHIDSEMMDGDVTITNKDIIPIIAELLEIEEIVISSMLLVQEKRISEETIIIPYTLDECKRFQQSICKSIYLYLFKWIISIMNRQLNVSDEKLMLGNINIVDMYRFENLVENNFEQFIGNYITEKIDNVLLSSIFRYRKMLYMSEGQEYLENNISYMNESLYSDKNCGLFILINEECRYRVGNAERLSQNIHSQNPSTSTHIKMKMLICHYKDTAKYDISTFREKNMDIASDIIMQIGIHTKSLFLNDIIQQCNKLQIKGMKSRYLLKNRHQYSNFAVFATLKSNIDMLKRVSEKSKADTVISKVEIAVQELIEEIEKSEPHIIRCINPNKLKEKRLFDESFVYQQLRHSTIFNQFNLLLKEYDNIMTKNEFQYQYDLILVHYETIENLLVCVGSSDHYKIGLGKIFLNNTILIKLDKIQNMCYKYITKNIFKVYSQIQKKESEKYRNERKFSLLDSTDNYLSSYMDNLEDLYKSSLNKPAISVRGIKSCGWPLKEGDCVRIPIPRIDRGRLDPGNLILWLIWYNHGVVTGVDHGQYTIGTSSGKIENNFTRNQIQKCHQQLINPEVPNQILSLRFTVREKSIGNLTNINFQSSRRNEKKDNIIPTFPNIPNLIESRKGIIRFCKVLIIKVDSNVTKSVMKMWDAEAFKEILKKMLINRLKTELFKITEVVSVNHKMSSDDILHIVKRILPQELKDFVETYPSVEFELNSLETASQLLFYEKCQKFKRKSSNLTGFVDKFSKAEETIRMNCGHRMVIEHSIIPHYCEYCNKLIDIYDKIYRCLTCEYVIHRKCLTKNKRICIGAKTVIKYNASNKYSEARISCHIFNRGYTQVKFARELSVFRCAVQEIIKKHQKGLPLINRPKKGRTRKMSVREDQINDVIDNSNIAENKELEDFEELRKDGIYAIFNNLRNYANQHCPKNLEDIFIGKQNDTPQLIRNLINTPIHQLIENDKIPPAIEKLLNYIETKKPYTERIYRLSGAKNKLDHFINILNHCVDDERVTQLNPDEYDISILCSSVKYFLNQLPEPLINKEFLPLLIEAAEMEDLFDRYEIISNIICRMPKHNVILFDRIINHLAIIARESNINKMDAHNLAIIFAPNVIQPNYDEKSMKNNLIDAYIKIIETMITTTIYIIDGMSEN